MSENNRELLELAAKAAGIEWYGFFGDDETECLYLDIGPSEVEPWNPLEDDGAALRLAVKRNVFFNPLFAHYLALERFAQQDPDDAKAHRCAIVRTVAAEILGTV